MEVLIISVLVTMFVLCFIFITAAILDLSDNTVYFAVKSIGIVWICYLVEAFVLQELNAGDWTIEQRKTLVWVSGILLTGNFVFSFREELTREL